MPLLLTLLLSLNACGGGGGAESAAPPPPPPAGWTRLADLPQGLAKFGAAAPGDGSLVLAGGYDTQRGSLIYDIASDRWRAGAALPRGSDNLAVLAAGGKVYALGGEARTAMAVFDPAANSWSNGVELPNIRFASAAAELNGRLYLAGGWNVNNNASASLATQIAFDLTRQVWVSDALAALPTARNAAAGAAIDGRFCVAGGRAPGIRATDQTPLARLDCYDPVANQWSNEAALPTARGSLAAAVLGGRLYTFGGETAARQVSDAVERWDPTTRSWQILDAMPYKAHGLAAVTVGDSIYVMGGFTQPADAVGSESRQLWRYRPQ